MPARTLKEGFMASGLVTHHGQSRGENFVAPRPASLPKSNTALKSSKKQILVRSQSLPPK